MNTTILDSAAARLFRHKRQLAEARTSPAADPFAAFADETAGAGPEPPSPAGPPPHRRLAPVWLVVVAVALAASSIAAVRLRSDVTTRASQTGTLKLDTVPAGVKVAIDGHAQGQTPLTLSLAPGAHVMALANGADHRTIPLTVVAGEKSSEHFEFAPKPVTQTVGSLSVSADVQSRVSVDGHSLGAAPIVVPNLPPGDHLISVTSQAGTISRKVVVVPGATASAAFSFVPSRPAGPAAGWMAFSAPFQVQVFEGDDLIGGSGAKVMVAAGHHTVRLVNESLQYAETRAVDVTAGKVSAIQIVPPKATLNINARPWADVSIDGTHIGQTPLANIPIAIGTHTVMFQHPQLGEQRRTVTVTEKGPNRVSADLTSK